MRKDVSVLVPVYSEVESLRETVLRTLANLGERVLEVWLLVHRESIPECWEVCRTLAAQDPRVKVHQQQRYPGQGYAYREGVELAQGSLILLMNADLETEPDHAHRLITAMDEGLADVVIASRWARGARFDHKSYGHFKWAANWIVQRFFMVLFDLKVNDLTFAYKVARSEVFKSTVWTGTGHEFAFESTIKPALLGYRIDQVPTSWVGRVEGASHQPLKRNLRHPILGLCLWGERWLDAKGFKERYRRSGKRTDRLPEADSGQRPT